MIVASIAALVLASAQGFHAPRTKAEHALDQLLRRADADTEQLDNLFQRYGPVPSASHFRTDGFSAITIKNNGPTEGTSIFDVGSTSVPTAVPEAATWALMILGFGGAGAMIRSRRTAPA